MISIVKGKTEISRSTQEECLHAGRFPSASLLAGEGAQVGGRSENGPKCCSSEEWPPAGAALKHCFPWWA